MKRQAISLRISTKVLRRVDALCERNGMGRTSFINFAIGNMVDYLSEQGVLPPVDYPELPPPSADPKVSRAAARLRDFLSRAETGEPDVYRSSEEAE